MRVADEKQRIGALHGHNKQSGRSGLGLSNFMQTKHAHEHFDLIIHVDIKTSIRMRISRLFDIRPFTYCLDQEYMHARFFFYYLYEKLEVLSELVNPINVTNQTFIMKHRPVAPGWRVSRTSVAMCTCNQSRP